MHPTDPHPLPPIVIGVAGGSGSGKTTVAVRVREAVPGRSVAVIPHDAYYFDNSHLPEAERERLNYDHPEAFETSLLVEHVTNLKRGETVAIPVYDYRTHTRLAERRRIEPADIIFVEGILVLESARLRELMDIRLFVDVAADERLIRRLRRDMSERGRSLESVVEQYQTVVRPMHDQFVEPSKRHAHLIIPEGGHNQVAIDIITTNISQIIRERGRLRGRSGPTDPAAPVDTSGGQV
jgi:uridine kinase